MLEATSLPIDPMIMPMNFPDMWWVISSITTVALLATVVFFLKRLVDKQDNMNDTLTTLLVGQNGTEIRLKDHIENTGVHCKGINCPALERRLEPR